MVAFCADEVYAIAELIRRQRGGSAVVMGGSSRAPATPRWRCISRARSTSWWRPTPSAWASTGRRPCRVRRPAQVRRPAAPRLTPAEVAQIAGRAGRGMRDGTFGAPADASRSTEDTDRSGRKPRVRAAEQVLLAQQRAGFYIARRAARQPAAPPPGPRPRCEGNDATDLRSAGRAGARTERSASWRAAGRVRRLWDACQIPDYRKLAGETHAELLRAGYSATSRATKAACRPTGSPGRSHAGDRNDGDIDTLIAAARRHPDVVLHRRPGRLGERRAALAGARRARSRTGCPTRCTSG